MEHKKLALTEFIQSYARHTAARDFVALVGEFADTFLAAGPAGAQCVRSADFVRALPRRCELFDSLGCQSAELIDMDDESWLGCRFALVRTTWRFTFCRPQNTIDTIDSVSILIIDTGSDRYRIVAYFSEEDIIETVQRRAALA